MRKINGVGAVVTGVALMLAVVPATGVMAHAGKGGSGLVHACIKNGVFQKAPQDASKKCPQGTTPAHWRIKGEQGPAGPGGGDPGPQGPQGPEGPQGPQGPAGADGADGADGGAGSQGPQGPEGPAGADGAQGPAGADGAQGPAGADGAQGPAGADGAQGPQGPAGADGAQGPAGADGAQGPSGVANLTVVTATGGSGDDTVGVSCVSPARAVGGGSSTTDGDFDNLVSQSRPLELYSTTDVAEAGDVPTGWFVEYENVSFGQTATAYAICAS